jgi:hypothetical protein
VSRLRAVFGIYIMQGIIDSSRSFSHSCGDQFHLAVIGRNISAGIDNYFKCRLLDRQLRLFFFFGSFKIVGTRKHTAGDPNPVRHEVL